MTMAVYSSNDVEQSIRGPISGEEHSLLWSWRVLMMHRRNCLMMMSVCYSKSKRMLQVKPRKTSICCWCLAVTTSINYLKLE